LWHERRESLNNKLFIHPPELVVRGKLVVTERGHFLGVPISEEEMETLRCQIEGNLSLSDQTDSAQPQSHTTPTTP
jgi:hypothetical protein